MLQAVQLPAGIAHLHSGLAHVDRDTLTLDRERGEVTVKLDIQMATAGMLLMFKKCHFSARKSHGRREFLLDETIVLYSVYFRA